MKFQKLTIHNIASIEDAVIDFEARPLADSEVFLITGKTGAGKSTILDAICLALYSETPRMHYTKMQGDINDVEKSVKINDPRQLMRRNTGEAFTSLTFTGSNGIHYEAKWSVTRAYKKVTGRIQFKDWQLKNLDAGLTLAKDKEIVAEIKAAIGLDFQQFCRTTMLAQGEFTRFLNSSDEEKAEILEKITGVDIYSKIGAKVFEVTTSKEQAWKYAQQLVEGTHSLDEAEIGQRKETLAALDKQLGEIKVLADKEADKRDWIKAEAELAKGANDASDALQKAKEAVESDWFKAKETLVRNWHATIDARAWLAEIQKAEEAKKKQKQALEGLAGEYSVLLSGQRYATAEVDKAIADLKEIEAFITAEAGKAVVYENAQTIAGHLGTIDSGQEAIDKSGKEISTENRSLNEELLPALALAKKAASMAKGAFEEKEAEVKKQEEAIVALDLPGLRTQREAVKDLLGKIAAAKVRIEALEEAKNQYETARRNLADQKSTLEVKKKTSAEMDEPIHDAKIRMDVRKEDLERQKDTIDKFASTLRLKLHIGDTCPVCRQKIETELPHEEELSALVNGLQEAYTTAESEHRKLAEAKVALEAEIRTETKAYEKGLSAFSEDKSVANASQKAQEACLACGMEKIEDHTRSALDALASDTTARYNTLDKQVSEAEEKEGKAKELRKALEAKRTQMEALAGKMLEAEKVVNDCRGRIHTAEVLIGTKRGDVEAAGRAVEGFMQAGDWAVDWKESPKDFAIALTSAAKDYFLKVQEKQALSGRLESLQTNCQNVASIIESISLVMPEWKSIEAAPAMRTEKLLDKANSIDNRVTIALTQLKEAEKSLSDNRTKLDSFLKGNDTLTEEALHALCAYTSNDIAHEDGELRKFLDAVVARNTLLENAKSLLKEHLEKKPEMNEEETLEALIVRLEGYEKQLGEIGEKRGAINQELKADQENKVRLGALMADAEQKHAEYLKWQRMNHLIGDATGNKFRKIAQSYVLTSLIHSANTYMKTLTDRYTLKVEPGTFVISLEDAYQGFVSRAASTISGGESFLVSLSLALALSDIGQTLSVDTLFIDEGFGTLSGEPLQNAIRTLRTLHTKAGRHVGIISHVEELQERIPVQIQVNQESNNSCSSIRIVPEVV